MGTVPATKRKGINIVSWSMRTKPPRVAQGVKLDGAGFYGPLCDPGIYTVKITKADKVISGEIVLIPDPKSPHSLADRNLRKENVNELFVLSEDLAFMNQQLLALKEQCANSKEKCSNTDLKKKLDKFNKELEEARAQLVATKGGEAITGEEKIRERLSELYGSVNGYEGRPSDSQLDKKAAVQADLMKNKATMKNLWDKNLSTLNTALKKEGLPELSVLQRTDFDNSGNTSFKSGAAGGNNLYKNFNSYLFFF